MYFNDLLTIGDGYYDYFFAPGNKKPGAMILISREEERSSSGRVFRGNWLVESETRVG